MRIPLGIVVNATQTASARMSFTVLSDSDDPTCGTLSQCRTIWNIIWSCLATIFACIWLSVHPNMPLPRPTFAGLEIEATPQEVHSWSQRKAIWLRAWLADVWSRRLPAAVISLVDKLSIAHFALLAPEFIFVWSLRQRLRAGRLAKECRAAANANDRTNWTLTHGFFILMGGFHRFSDGKPGVILLPKDVIALIRRGRLASPSKEELLDRSKTDSFSKLIVVGQTLWFMTQSIARRIEHLPITELEISTLAYTTVIVGVYLCWWDKPLAVTQPVRIPGNIWRPTGQSSINEVNRFMRPFRIVTGEADKIKNPHRIPRFFSGASWSETVAANMITSVLTALFGAIHCFAWSYHFASHVERRIWRITSLAITCIPMLWLALSTIIIIGVKTGFKPKEDFWADDDLSSDAQSSKATGVRRLVKWVFLSVFYFIYGCVIISMPLYLVARAALITIAFTSLRSLPKGAYEDVSWTTYIPHV